jgi:uncharacterized protein (TIGR02444 family)
MTAKKSAATNSLWRFSLMLYARPGVAPALLALQDRGGHNVNVILFGIWLGLCHGAALDAAGLARARAAVEELDVEVVRPLRRLRRVLKASPDPDIQAARQRVLALEIAIERRIQARLAACITPRPAAEPEARAALAEANLKLVLGDDAASPESLVLRETVAAFVRG